MFNYHLPCLLLIDIQKGLDEWSFYGTERNNHHAEEMAARLLTHWREQKGLVIHVKHNSTNPQSPLFPTKAGNQIKDIVAPNEGEIVLTKNVNSAFIGTSLEKILQDHKIERIVMAGLTIEHCISTSVRMASNLGFKVYLVTDATAAFSKKGHKGQQISSEDVFNISLANLDHEFCTLTTTGKLLMLQNKPL